MAASPAGRICVFRPTFMGGASSIRVLAVRETQGYKPPSCRSVAQPGRALRSGRRGRRFKSCHSDQDIFAFLAVFPLTFKTDRSCDDRSPVALTSFDEVRL